MSSTNTLGPAAKVGILVAVAAWGVLQTQYGVSVFAGVIFAVLLLMGGAMIAQDTVN